MPGGRLILAHAGRKQSGSTRKIAKKALRIAKGNVPEQKDHDTGPLAVAATGVWEITRLSTPAIGDAGNSRDGDVVNSVGLELNGHIFMSSSATQTSVRIVILMDKENDGVEPVVTDVFVDDTPFSLYNANSKTRKRYRILSDREFSYSITGSQHGTYKQKIKLRGKQYFSSVVTDADTAAGRNSLWAFICHNESVNEPAMTIDCRYKFRDP